MRSAWDVMVDDETYTLLEEYYGREVEFSEMLPYLDKAGVARLLDNIIDESGYYSDDSTLEEFARRAKQARKELR